MAFIRLYRDKLQHNYKFLDKLFSSNRISWGVVTKLLCGNKLFLKELMEMGIEEMHDTRISNMRTIKSLNPSVQTVYIKPPAKRSIANVVRYSDVSHNTNLFTITKLSEEAVKQDKIHKVVIMVEMGDLREGVMGYRVMEIYEQVFLLPNIEVIGLGTNLNCLNGVMPNPDKLIELCSYKEVIEKKFNKKIPWISGGTSVTLSLLLKQQIPEGVNHFRIGEALFFGTDLVDGKPIKGMKTDVVTLHTEIIELYHKPIVPEGEQGENVAGSINEFNPEDIGKYTNRAIVDIGLLDINLDYLIPEDPNVNIIEASSDMLVVDLGENDNKKVYKTGDLISFNLRYMGALGIMNSNYIEKIVS